MRGIRNIGNASGSSGRITPAYAGNTCTNQGTGYRLQDHPRLCGEYSLRQNNTRSLVGSPPPMRGILKNYQMVKPDHRITPAYAGNTNRMCFCLGSRKDHPRLCGEYPTRRARYCCQVGSPPPMRGILIGYIHNGSCIRITPAYAGNTFFLFLTVP